MMNAKKMAKMAKTAKTKSLAKTATKSLAMMTSLPRIPRCIRQKISERAMRVWGGCKRRKNNALEILIAVGAVVLTIALIII